MCSKKYCTNCRRQQDEDTFRKYVSGGITRHVCGECYEAKVGKRSVEQRDAFGRRVSEENREENRRFVSVRWKTKKG
jgi:hypothetical protein